MGIALAKLAEEDPTFRTYTDEETGQTIIAGMGELHLEIIVDRLLREFKVEANIGKPQVAYKETIRKKVDHECQVQDVSPAVPVSTVMSRSSLSPTSPARATSSSTPSSAALSRRNSLPAVDAGYPERNAERCPRRLQRRRRKGHSLRRFLPRGRLLRNGVQDRRLHGFQGSYAKGRSRTHRADHEGHYHHSRTITSEMSSATSTPAAVRSSRMDDNGKACQRDHRDGSAVRNVRLRNRSAFEDRRAASVT